MKARTIALLWLMASVALAAQTAAPAPKTAAKPAATQAKPAAAPAPSAAPAKPAAAKPAASAKPAAAKAAVAKPAAKPAAQAAKPAVAKTPAGKPAGKPAAKPAAPKRAVAKSTAGAAKPARVVHAAKRDPFVSPIRTSAGPDCPTGKKCLIIDTIVLKGIAKTQAGNIALVESATRRATYFLRENDPVFNGFVVKITGDTVVFRENVMDALGRKSTREVVKKVVAPVV